MDYRDKKSFALGIILLFLIIPLILMFIYYQFQNYFVLLSIGLSFSAILIWYTDKLNLIKIGFAISLVAWILNLYITLFAIVDYSLMQINAAVIKSSLDLLEYNYYSSFENIFFYKIPTIAFNSPFMIIIVLNLISTSFSIVFGSIIFERSRKLIKEIDNFEDN